MEVRQLDNAVRGEKIRSCEHDGFSLLELSFPPAHRMPPHSHDLAYLEYALQGSYTERYGKRIRSLDAAAVIQHPPGETHSYQFDNTQARVFCIGVKMGFRDDLRSYGITLDESIAFRDSSLALLAMQLYREFRFSDPVAPLAREGLVLEIMAEVSRKHVGLSTGGRPRWLSAVRDLLHARFAENITIAVIAQSVDVHPAHLTRAFRSHFHCTIGEYMRKLRTEFACRELAVSDEPLSQIALAAGFADHSHFSRTFKLYTGLTPVEFRKRLLKRLSASSPLL